MVREEEVLRAYIAENILFSGSHYPHSDDASFLGEGVVDSMNVLQLVMFVEKDFGIRVDDDDITPENFDSIARLAEFVRRKRQSSEGLDGPEHGRLSPAARA
jgi:acyl carrier protein